MEKVSTSSFKKNISIDQCKDTGMALVLLTMILNCIVENRYWIILGIALLFITMSVPKILKPVGKLWFGMAQLLGTYVSKIILCIVYYAVVTPAGVLRRILKKDSLKLREFKRGRKSVMEDRNVTYKSVDIVKPF
jgi:hypothetical protein